MLEVTNDKVDDERRRLDMTRETDSDTFGMFIITGYFLFSTNYISSFSLCHSFIQ